jgi:para-aminobenzoate synthetase / 4-amino-4-deoxychorismate lyase
MPVAARTDSGRDCIQADARARIVRMQNGKTDEFRVSCDRDGIVRIEPAAGRSATMRIPDPLFPAHDMPAASAPFALFDDNLTCDGDLLFDTLRETITCMSTNEIEQALGKIETFRRDGCWVVVAIAYELGHAFEKRLPQVSGPLLTAWVFERVRHMQSRETGILLAGQLSELDEHQRVSAVAGLHAGVGREAYIANVERIRSWIADGDCYQVNYTFPIYGQCLGDPLALYSALRERQPVRYGAFIRHAHGAILSRSPELFVERQGQLLRCRPMKGTAPRDADPEAVLGSDKNRAENVMIVDLIRNDLGRLVPPGGVRVDSLFDIEAYPSLWQMTSTVSATPVSADLPEILRALFPCGSITGAPKIRAMEIISALETIPRSLYCGALGWIAPDGDFRFSVPIRTLEADRDGHFRCGLGSGIVADSDPAQEWDECLLKGRFLTGLQAPFGLIETLRCEPRSPHPYPRLELHLARLAASSAFMGFRFDAEAVRGALIEHARSLPGLYRVRLELQPDGRFTLSGSPLADIAGAVKVAIGSAVLRSDDPLLRHKTTARALYEAASREAEACGLFDLIFLNERNEVAEGARSTVFIDRGDGMLLTPPLSCGVLDGVLRRELLDAGRAS